MPRSSPLNTVGSGIRFSIITISYNNIDGLKATVNSVKTQRETSYEHIVVDNKSTDGSLDWLRSSQPTYGFRWPPIQDDGIYDAMNIGLSEASGDLILILNSGDTLSEATSLTKVWDDYTENEWQWAYGAIRMVRSGNLRNIYSFTPYSYLQFTLGQRWVPHAAAFVAREFAAELGEYRTDMGTTADQEYFMRAARLAYPRLIPWIISDYEVDGLSSTVGPRHREIAWHHMRTSAGASILGSRALDRLVSEIIGAKNVAVYGLKRNAKRLVGHK